MDAVQFKDCPPHPLSAILNIDFVDLSHDASGQFIPTAYTVRRAVQARRPLSSARAHPRCGAEEIQPPVQAFGRQCHASYDEIPSIELLGPPGCR